MPPGFTCISLLLALLCLFPAADSAFAAMTACDYVGRWEGTAQFTAEGESESGPITMQLSADGDTVSGTLTVFDDPPLDIEGIPKTMLFTFDITNPDPDDPDCAKWDLSAVVFLQEDLMTIKFSAAGIFCGEGGSKPGSLSATLEKKIFNSPPLLLLLLKEK